MRQYGKYVTPGHATDNNTAHALCMLDNKVHRCAIIKYNIYCFSTEKNGYANAHEC